MQLYVFQDTTFWAEQKAFPLYALAYQLIKGYMAKTSCVMLTFLLQEHSAQKLPQ